MIISHLGGLIGGTDSTRVEPVRFFILLLPFRFPF